MTSYVPNTKDTTKKMMDAIGISDIEEMFENIPSEVRLKGDICIDNGKSEIEVRNTICQIARKNRVYKSCFLGAGVYNHYIPSVVTKIASTQEFVTAYTPYQAEISQGVLQAIFEYQTYICNLTGMEASNASVYDGATALAEACMMSVTNSKRIVLVSEGVNPEYIKVLKTWCKYADLQMEFVKLDNYKTDPEDLKSKLNGDIASVVIQNPNFYGTLEDMDQFEEYVHGNKSTFIAVVNPISLAVLKSPAEYNADIAVGEGQSLGNPMANGGPYLGFMAASKKLTRKLPGRIVGQTTDLDGKRGFVLTLQAREQHIRREKASSNICSNQALNALTAAAYLGAMGEAGLKQVACRSMENAYLLKNKLRELDGVEVYQDDIFNEFVAHIPCDNKKLDGKLKENDILGGLYLGDSKYLFAATELNSADDINQLVSIIKEVC